MGDFRQSGGKRFGQGYGGGSGKRPGFVHRGAGAPGDRDRGPVTMHQATCAQCGNPCEVPFRPFEGRSIYCKNCFQGKKDGQENRSEDRFPQKKYGSNRSFTGPDFKNNDRDGNNGELRGQLETLNAKMDRLIAAVEAIAGAKLPAVEEKTGETAETIPAAKIRKSGKKVFKKKKNVRPF